MIRYIFPLDCNIAYHFKHKQQFTSRVDKWRFRSSKVPIPILRSITRNLTYRASVMTFTMYVDQLYSLIAVAIARWLKENTGMEETNVFYTCYMKIVWRTCSAAGIILYKGSNVTQSVHGFSSIIICCQSYWSRQTHYDAMTWERFPHQ